MARPLLRLIYIKILINMAISIRISIAIRANIRINNDFSTASNANMAMRINIDANQYQWSYKL